jgi:hypothetical protein
MKAEWCWRPIIDTPFDFCLCVNEEQYRRELKRLKIPKDMWGEFTLNGKRATVHRFTCNDGDPVAFVCIRPTKDKTIFQMHAVLAHEAVHLKQWMMELIGEDNPSAEFEAYAVQALSQRLFYAYDKLSGKKK